MLCTHGRKSTQVECEDPFSNLELREESAYSWINLETTNPYGNTRTPNNKTHQLCLRPTERNIQPSPATQSDHSLASIASHFYFTFPGFLPGTTIASRVKEPRYPSWLAQKHSRMREWGLICDNPSKKKQWKGGGAVPFAFANDMRKWLVELPMDLWLTIYLIPCLWGAVSSFSWVRLYTEGPVYER